MTRQYEAVYVFDSTLEDAAINEKLGRFHGLLGNPGDLEVNHWGRRRLAYPISRHFEGNYVVSQIKMDPAEVPGLEGTLRISEEVIRHIFITESITHVTKTTEARTDFPVRAFFIEPMAA